MGGSSNIDILINRVVNRENVSAQNLTFKIPKYGMWDHNLEEKLNLGEIPWV